MDRESSGTVLIGLGLLLAIISVATGGLTTGYGMGPTAVLLRVGVAYLVLGTATVALRSMTVIHAAAVAITALVSMFAVGAAVMYYDLVVTPPQYGTPLTATRLVANQAELTIGLAPVPAGYVGGVLAQRNRPLAAVGTVVVTAIAGSIGTTSMMLAQGAAGLAGIFVLVLTIAALGFALVPLLLLRRSNGRKQPTDTSAIES